MKTLSSLVLSGAMVVALAAGAAARPAHRAPENSFNALTTGRSAYVDTAPRGDADADQIVMGLRVPHRSPAPETSIAR